MRARATSRFLGFSCAHCSLVHQLNMFLLHAVLGAALGSVVALGQTSSCSTTLTPTKSVRPTVASGYRMALVATALTSPRSIQFDTAGNLLVVQSGAGIANLAFQDDGGTCLTVKTKKTVVSASAVSISFTKELRRPRCSYAIPRSDDQPMNSHQAL